MKIPFELLEDALRKIIEGSLALTPMEGSRITLAQQITRALELDLGTADPADWRPPQGFIIIMQPDMAAAWRAHPEWITGLAQAVQSAALEIGIHFAQPPVLVLLTDPSLPENNYVIRTKRSEPLVAPTVASNVREKHKVESASSYPVNAYLLLENGDTYHLQLPVINIGRRLDNHIVLDDTRVSRTHCQLRIVQGQYMVFDLNSSAGTTVNGVRITQCVLTAGDVISCAGVTLVYNQDAPAVAPCDDCTDEWPSLPPDPEKK